MEAKEPENPITIQLIQLKIRLWRNGQIVNEFMFNVMPNQSIVSDGDWWEILKP